MKRRDFIKNTFKTAGIISLSQIPYKSIAGDQKKYASDIVKIGTTGITTSRMAMGTGSNGWRGSSNQTRQLGLKGLADLLIYGVDKGVFFWDSADQYGTHGHLKEALKIVPREKVRILTKTHATTEEEMNQDLDRFREEIGTDYLDFVLLHNMRDPNWAEIKKPAMEVLSKAKQDKIVGAHGVSCHTFEALKVAADTDWVEVDMVRFNPAGVYMDDEPEAVAKVIQKMKDKGKGIIGMKIFGVGKLIDRKDECIKYHLSHNFIDASTIGIENKEQLDDILERYPIVSAEA